MAKRGTLEHPKNRRLARSLKTNLGTTLGLLETIWHRAAQYHPSGAMSKLDLEDAFDAGGWLNIFDSNRLIEALTNKDHAWLDLLPDGTWYIHDWHDHCDDSTHAKLYRSIIYFANGNTPLPKKVNGVEKISLEELWKHAKKPCFSDGRPTAAESSVAAAESSPPDALPCLALPCLAQPSRPGSEPKTIEEKAAHLSTEWWFYFTGRKKPLVNEHAPEFLEKMRIYGEGSYQIMLNAIKDPARDKTWQIFRLWQICGLDEPPKPIPKPTVIVQSPEEIEHNRKCQIARERQLRLREEAAKAAKAGPVLAEAS